MKPLPFAILLVGLAMSSAVDAAEVQQHNGRPTIFIDGKPTALPTYSPRGWHREGLQKGVPGFAKHPMGAYFIAVPGTRGGGWGETPFWHQDTIRFHPEDKVEISLDEQAEFILKQDPDAYLIVRNGPAEPPSWRALHRDQLVVTETGQTLEVPSLASELAWQGQAKVSRAIVEYCESRPWSNRIIGYWYGLRVEGSHEPLMEHWLFDHSPVMLARWRACLREKYKTVEALRAAYRDPALSFETVQVPFDKLRGTTTQVSNLLYWQGAADNQPLRDYLLLTRDLFHAGFKQIAAENAQATTHQRLFVYDAFKQVMQGWTNWGFFNLKYGWPLAYAELMAGSGHMNVAELFSVPGCDGVVTPHDYQYRGVGGICEPEGIVDSVVLRGKYFFCELDIRTYQDDRENGAYGTARNLREFAAINWRDAATALTRGFNGYWMDLSCNWYANADIQQVIGRTVDVINASVDWPHATVPGIAMIIDDSAILETNGAGNVLNETVMWENKMGMAHCGVPYRIYLLEDLALDQFPEHRVFYFPNLYKVDDARLELLRRKVFRDGNVVLWGPGSGISDGRVLGPASASRLTGFAFEYLPVNHPRRFSITNFEHPLTRGLAADTVVGGPLAYGPLLYPRDGVMLGLASTKQARNYAGLAIKEFGQGARGAPGLHLRARGAGDWASVFTTAAPLPADLWRNLARYAGAHVYCDTNDVLLADSSIVALHSNQSGEKLLRLPARCTVEDVVTGKRVARRTAELRFTVTAPETRVFRLLPP